MSRLSENVRVVIVTALILLAMLVILILHAPSTPTTTNLEGGPAPAGTLAPGAQVMTLDPQIINNMTEYAKATPLAGQAANDMTALRALVDACPDYDAARRSQMDQQIQYLINPASLPREIVIALGSDPHGKLIYILANLTKVQWQLAKSPANSCLVTIGKRLNQMLVASDQPPISAFEGG